MALRKIVEQGDECLTKVCRPVVKFDRRLHDLLDDMAETLAEFDREIQEDRKREALHSVMKKKHRNPYRTIY